MMNWNRLGALSLSLALSLAALSGCQGGQPGGSGDGSGAAWMLKSSEQGKK